MPDFRHSPRQKIELGWVAFIIFGVDHQHSSFDVLQLVRRIETARGFPLVKRIVGIADFGVR